jgi:hypothetical protein
MHKNEPKMTFENKSKMATVKYLIVVKKVCSIFYVLADVLKDHCTSNLQRHNLSFNCGNYGLTAGLITNFIYKKNPVQPNFSKPAVTFGFLICFSQVYQF